MAPEVVLAGYKDSSGEQSQYDERIDVWAVGKSDLTISLKMLIASCHLVVSLLDKTNFLPMTANTY